MLKPYKKEADHSYTFGVFPTVELLQHRPEAALRVLVSEAGWRNRGVVVLEELCRDKSVPFEVNDRALQRLAPRENTYALGVFRKYSQQLDVEAGHVVLVNPSDMGNLGTIMRTMLGFGVADLALVHPAADLFDPRAVRASMGALFQMRFEYFRSFDAYRERFVGHGLYTFMTGAARTLSEVAFARPFALVFGNESSGLPPDYLQAGESVRIPQSSRIDSLNLPVAVAVALYEATKGALE